jgi:acyl carrier protein
VRDELIREIAARARVKAGDVKPDVHLVHELGLSSLDLLAVLAFAEHRFQARFPDGILHDLVTVERIEEAIRTHPARVKEKEGA